MPLPGWVVAAGSVATVARRAATVACHCIGVVIVVAVERGERRFTCEPLFYQQLALN